MTREEAISYVLLMESYFSSEFCVGSEERDRSAQEALDALAALGVSAVEIEENR